MRGVPLVVVVVVAACSGDHGASLGVSVPPGVTSVELLIAPHQCEQTLGNDACKNANGVVWDTTRMPRAGEVFIQNTDEVLAATVENGEARFRLESTAGDDFVERIVIIGYDDAKKPLAYAMLANVTVPIHNAVEWQVTLRVLPDIGNVAADGVHVWKPKNQAMTCVAYEHSDGRFDFIVPAGDTDCDDAEPECNAFWWQFKPDVNGAGCFTQAATDQPCLLGTGGCSDGAPGGSTACSPTPQETCATDTFCAKCDSIDTPCLEAAVELAATADVFIACKFPADVTGQPCAGGGMGVANNFGNTDAFEAPLANVGATCDTPALLAPKYPFATNGTLTTASGMKFSVNKTDAACTLQFRFEAAATPIVQGTSEHAMVALTVATATNGTTRMLLPLVLGVEPGVCPTADITAQICQVHGLQATSTVLACVVGQ
jgi:hypothetical protein